MSFVLKAYDWHIEDQKNVKNTLIKIYGMTSTGETVLVRVENYKPYVFVELPIYDKNCDTYTWDEENVKAVYTFLCDSLKQNAPISYKFIITKKLYFYQKNAKYPVIRLRFNNQHEAIKHLENFTKKQDRVIPNIQLKDGSQCDSPISLITHMGLNINVAIKFVRERGLEFSGWLLLSDQAKLISPTQKNRISTCNYEYICNPNDVVDGYAYAMQQKYTLPNPLVHSFDIEQYSHKHRRFPKKDDIKDEVLSLVGITLRAADDISTSIVDIISRKDCTSFTHYLCVKERQGEINDIDTFMKEVEYYEQAHQLWKTKSDEEMFEEWSDIIGKFNVTEELKVKYRSILVLKTESDTELIAAERKDLYTEFIKLLYKRSQYKQFLIPASQIKFHKVGSELELFKKWSEILILRNPQIIIGYNNTVYDLYVIETRLTTLYKSNIGPCSMLKGAIPTFTDDSWGSNAFKNQVFRLYNFEGRITLDILKIVQRDYKLRSYKMGAVSEMFVNDSKVEMEYEDLFKLWERGSPSDIHQIIDYNIYDCVLPIKLFKKLNVWIGCSEFSNIFGIPIMDIFGRGQQIRTLSQIVKKCMQEQYVLDQYLECRVCKKWYYNGYVAPENEKIHSKTSKKAKPRTGCCSFDCYFRWDGVWFEDLSEDDMHALGYEFESKEEEDDFWQNQVIKQGKYKGAYVVEPKLGLHKFVHTLDFKSLYPSIMIAFNICWSTLVNKLYGDDVPDDDCNIVTDESTGEVHKFKKWPIGLLPSICKELLDERKKTRGSQKGLSSTTIEWLILEMRQLALKLSANSAYGGMGTLSGKTAFRPGAVSVTACGRKLINSSIEYGTEKYNMNLIYGDTDSCMFNIPNIIGKEMIPFVTNMVNDINTRFPDPVMFEYEKQLYAIFNIAKKMYNYIWMDKNGNPVIEYTDTSADYYILPGCESGITGKRIDFNSTLCSKGVVSVRRENTFFLQEIFIQMSYRLCMGITIDEAMDTVNDAILALFHYRYPISKLTKNNEIGSNYAADNPTATSKRKQSIPPFVQLARSLSLKGDVREAGERINYIYITNNNHKADLCDCIQEPTWWRKNDCLPRIDFCMYVEKQFLESISKILDIAFPVTTTGTDTTGTTTDTTKNTNQTFYKYIEKLLYYHRLYRLVRRQLVSMVVEELTDNNDRPLTPFYIKIECTKKPPYLPLRCWNPKAMKRYSGELGKINIQNK